MPINGEEEARQVFYRKAREAARRRERRERPLVNRFLPQLPAFGFGAVVGAVFEAIVRVLS